MPALGLSRREQDVFRRLPENFQRLLAEEYQGGDAETKTEIRSILGSPNPARAIAGALARDVADIAGGGLASGMGVFRRFRRFLKRLSRKAKRVLKRVVPDAALEAIRKYGPIALKISAVAASPLTGGASQIAVGLYEAGRQIHAAKKQLNEIKRVNVAQAAAFEQELRVTETELETRQDQFYLEFQEIFVEAGFPPDEWLKLDLGQKAEILGASAELSFLTRRYLTPATIDEANSINTLDDRVETMAKELGIWEKWYGDQAPLVILATPERAGVNMFTWRQLEEQRSRTGVFGGLSVQQNATYLDYQKRFEFVRLWKQLEGLAEAFFRKHKTVIEVMGYPESVWRTMGLDERLGAVEDVAEASERARDTVRPLPFLQDLEVPQPPHAVPPPPEIPAPGVTPPPPAGTRVFRPPMLRPGEVAYKELEKVSVILYQGRPVFTYKGKSYWFDALKIPQWQFPITLPVVLDERNNIAITWKGLHYLKDLVEAVAPPAPERAPAPEEVSQLRPRPGWEYVVTEAGGAVEEPSGYFEVFVEGQSVGSADKASQAAKIARNNTEEPDRFEIFAARWDVTSGGLVGELMGLWIRVGRSGAVPIPRDLWFTVLAMSPEHIREIVSRAKKRSAVLSEKGD